MNPENGIKCPECNTVSCVIGKADSRYSYADDDKFYFYPINIIQKSFWKIIYNRIDIKNNGNLYACYKCGYLWGRVNANELFQVLEKLEWNGELQEEPNRIFALPKIAEWILKTVVISLLLFIIYVYFKT